MKLQTLIERLDSGAVVSVIYRIFCPDFQATDNKVLSKSLANLLDQKLDYIANSAAKQKKPL